MVCSDGKEVSGVQGAKPLLIMRIASREISFQIPQVFAFVFFFVPFVPISPCVLCVKPIYAKGVNSGSQLCLR